MMDYPRPLAAGCATPTSSACSAAPGSPTSWCCLAAHATIPSCILTPASRPRQLLLEYMEHGSLRDFLQQPDVELEWHLDPLLRMACDVARAMCVPL